MIKNLLTNKLYQSDLIKTIESFDLNQLDNKNILIIGASGLIGSAIVDLLLFYNIKKNGNIKLFVTSRNIELLRSKYKEFYYVNYVKFDAIDSSILIGSYDYILYCAGLSSPELYVSNPVEVMLSNINGVEKVLEYARKNSVKRILYVSSSEVYGKNIIANDFVENECGFVDFNNIRSSYPIAKQASELLCKSYCEEYGLDIVLARPGHIYGPTANKNDKRVVSEFVYSAALGNDLYLKSSGLQLRSYCYGLECGISLLIILLNGDRNEAYNIGHGEPITIKDMARIIAKAGNVKLSYREPTPDELKAFNPMMNSSLNIEKIKKIGYQDVFTTEEGLIHTVKIIKECINK